MKEIKLRVPTKTQVLRAIYLAVMIVLIGLEGWIYGEVVDIKSWDILWITRLFDWVIYYSSILIFPSVCVSIRKDAEIKWSEQERSL